MEGKSRIEPRFLTTALGLYLSAFGWALWRGPDNFLTGLLSGCGSITLGVWLGLVVSHSRGYTRVTLEDVMGEDNDHDAPT